MAEKNEKLKTKSLEKEVEFMGVKLKPNNLTNIHLKRIVVNMCESDYKFRYKDYDDHERTKWKDDFRKKYHEEYKEYSEYGDYSDWKNNRWDDYRCVHPDDQ